MKTYIKLMLDIPLSNASRNKRELAAAYESGYNVVVFCGEEELQRDEELSRYKIIFHGELEAAGKNRWVHRFNILRAWFRFGRELAREKPSVISCHNLPNLFLAWGVTRLMLPRPKLIYDSHEFALYDAFSNRSPREQAKTVRREKFLMKRCAFSIMVNDSIADAVQQAHGLRQRPVVVRSTPPRWELDAQIIAEKRKEMCERLGAGEDAFLAMYHGMIHRARGIDTLLEAVAMNPRLYAVIMGTGNMQEAEEMALQLGMRDRLLCLPSVPVADIWQYVGAADASLCGSHNICQSYYLTLPNKVFEGIQSMTPLVCSDFPELRRLVDEYGIGLLYDSEDASSLYAALERLRTDREFYALCKANLIRAKEELCWEREKDILLEAFRRYL